MGTSVAAGGAAPSFFARMRIFSTDRLTGLDAARGLALLAMMATHIVPERTATGELSWAYEWASGRASVLFCVIAGIALAYTTRDPFAPHTRRRILVRAAMLLLIGLTLSTGAIVISILRSIIVGYETDGSDLNVAVILVNYGALFIVGALAIRARWFVLAVVGGMWLAVGPITSHVIRPSLPVFFGEQPTFITVFEDPVARFCEVVFTGYYPVWVWAGYFLVGMTVGKLDLRSARVAGIVAGVGAVLVGVAHMVAGVFWSGRSVEALPVPENTLWSWTPIADSLEAGFYGTVPANDPAWLMVLAPHSGTIVDGLHVVGVALVVTGLFIAAARAVPFARYAMWPLAATGSITLSLYVVHVLTVSWLYREYWEQALGAVIIAMLYSLAGLRGPLEALLSRLARWA